MLVELNSLLPLLTERLENSVVENALSTREEKQKTFYSFREELPEVPQSFSAESSGESRISVLLEQLLRVAERSAGSTEKVADLMEQQEENPHVTFS